MSKNNKIMTMTNAEWCVKNNIKFKEIHVPYDTKTKEAKIIYRSKEIGRSNNCDTSFAALKTWLDMKHIEPVLDDVERRYLSVVIKPFKNKIDYIIKNSCVSKDLEILSIVSTNDEWMDFFPFAKGSMYKGMETDREYTLEELGLKDDE